MIGTKARKSVTPRLTLDMASLMPGAAQEARMLAGQPDVEVPSEIAADPGMPRTGLADVVASLPAPQLRSKGFFGRVDDWLHAPNNAAALFRSGAETLRNGFGSGLAAGAGYIDQRKAIEQQEEQQAAENQLAQQRQMLAEQQERNRNALGWGGLGVDVGRLRETQRSNIAREGIDANGQRIQLYGIDTGAATARRGQDVSLQANREDNATTQRGQDLGYQSSIYGNNLNYLSEASRYGVNGMGGAGIGSKAYTQSQTKIPGKPASNGWFGMGATEAVPEQIVTTRVPLMAPTTPPGVGSPPQQAIEALKANPNLRAQFDAKYGAGKSAQYLGGK